MKATWQLKLDNACVKLYDCKADGTAAMWQLELICLERYGRRSLSKSASGNMMIVNNHILSLERV